MSRSIVCFKIREVVPLFSSEGGRGGYKAQPSESGERQRLVKRKRPSDYQRGLDQIKELKNTLKAKKEGPGRWREKEREGVGKPRGPTGVPSWYGGPVKVVCSQVQAITSRCDRYDKTKGGFEQVDVWRWTYAPIVSESPWGEKAAAASPRRNEGGMATKSAYAEGVVNRFRKACSSKKSNIFFRTPRHESGKMAEADDPEQRFHERGNSVLGWGKKSSNKTP